MHVKFIGSFIAATVLNTPKTSVAPHLSIYITSKKYAPDPLIFIPPASNTTPLPINAVTFSG